MYSYKKLSATRGPRKRLSPRLPQHIKNFARVCAGLRAVHVVQRRIQTYTHPKLLRRVVATFARKYEAAQSGSPLLTQPLLLLQNQARARRISPREEHSDTESWQARGLPPLRICSPPATHARAGARTTCQDEGQQRRAEHSPSSPPLHLSKRRLQPTTSSHRHIEE